MSGVKNLTWILNQADEIDQFEGQKAYYRYNEMTQRYADKYHVPLSRVTAAFCSLSPNNDYVGNLRSLTSILEGLENGKPHDEIVVSTYNHCKDRAIMYLLGQNEFVIKTKGLKILNFYNNIIDPENDQYVTIDGHMVAGYRGKSDMNMKEAIISKREYKEIADIVKSIAKKRSMLPHQIQATIWFTCKRLYKIKFNPNIDLFSLKDDIWRVLIPIEELPAYAS